MGKMRVLLQQMQFRVVSSVGILEILFMNLDVWSLIYLNSFIVDLLRDAVKNGDYIAVKVALNSNEDYNLDQEVIHLSKISWNKDGK